MTATFRQPERTFIIHARIRLPTPGIKMQNETESLKRQHEALNSDTLAFFNYDMTWRNNLLKVPKLPNPSDSVTKNVPAHSDLKLVFKHNYYQHTTCNDGELHVGVTPQTQTLE